MTWNADEQRAIANALLGSWPETIARWGQEAFSAYISELQARGLEANDVLCAIRTWPEGSDFPPSAPNLAAEALRDPDQPTWPEAYQLIYGSRGALKASVTGGRFDNEAQMIGARLNAARSRAYELNPWVGAFVESFGVERLWAMPIHDDDNGPIRLRELEAAWGNFCESQADRSRASLVAGANPQLRRGLRQADFHSLIPGPGSPRSAPPDSDARYSEPSSTETSDQVAP